MVAFCACSFVNSSSRTSILCGSSGLAVGLRAELSELAFSKDSVDSDSLSSLYEPMVNSDEFRCLGAFGESILL